MICKKMNVVFAPSCRKQPVELRTGYLRDKVLFGINRGMQNQLFQFIMIFKI